MTFFVKIFRPNSFLIYNISYLFKKKKEEKSFYAIKYQWRPNHIFYTRLSVKQARPILFLFFSLLFIFIFVHTVVRYPVLIKPEGYSLVRLIYWAANAQNISLTHFSFATIATRLLFFLYYLHKCIFAKPGSVVPHCWVPRCN